MSFAKGCFCNLVTVAGGTPQMTAVLRIFVKKSSVSWASVFDLLQPILQLGFFAVIQGQGIDPGL